MTDEQLQDPTTPSKGRIVKTTIAAVVVAAVLLIVVILPAEYDIDPTGLGGLMGLTDLNSDGTTTFEIVDVIGGNETYREVEIPDAGQPVPLPNPAVFQQAEVPPTLRTLAIEVPEFGSTEIKMLLPVGKVAVFDWSIEGADTVYVDFHGHQQGDSEYWVRYREQMEGPGGAGSLVAPFTGEHGWYFLNYNEVPVTIHLTITGYFDEIIDYGIF